MSSKDPSNDNNQSNLNITNENYQTNSQNNNSHDSQNISKLSNKEDYSYNKIFQRTSNQKNSGRKDELKVPRPDRDKDISLSPIRTSSAINSHRSMNSYRSQNDNDSIERADRDNMSARKINLSKNEIKDKESDDHDKRDKFQSSEKKKYIRDRNLSLPKKDKGKVEIKKKNNEI